MNTNDMAKKLSRKQIEQYEHADKDRANNPPVGLVSPVTDPDTGEKKTYEYDPHLDPQLQWAGKAEHTSFEVPTVSLHVHERIDPKTIIDTVKKEKDDGGQMSLFAEKKPLREAIDFYKHKEGWTNRLIAGDSLLVMNSLLEKEGMAGKVQMVYFDPPYGIKYGSNFQPFVKKSDVKDGKDDDLSTEPEMLKAFRDTWELGIHSYLTYIRDRVLLVYELIKEDGGIMLQIGDENLHHVREVLDEVFGPHNLVSIITLKKTHHQESALLPNVADYIIWYAKDKTKLKYRPVRPKKTKLNVDYTKYKKAELADGTTRPLSEEERENPSLIPDKDKPFRDDITLTGTGGSESEDDSWEIAGKEYFPGSGRHWRTSEDGRKKLLELGRVAMGDSRPFYKAYWDDTPSAPYNNIWADMSAAQGQVYVVQTNVRALQRAILMSTDPSDIVFDITCGSGTTAVASEDLGRRWITCDTSRVALTLAKQRLMSSFFDYYELKYPSEGVSGGIRYETVQHLRLSDLAKGNLTNTAELLEYPIKEKSKIRITGPFTVEAVPAPYAKSFDDLEPDDTGSDTSIARTGETLRQSEWRDELLRAGVRAKGGSIIQFTRVEPLSGTKYIQAEAETKEDTPKKVLVVFGPEHAPLEQRTVENAWQEARALKPDMLLFCAFQFDEEAAKDIDELTPAIAGMQLLKAQMNADLLTDDLRKKRSSNESFWLIGQPDVKVHKLESGKVQVEVMGFDYYNPKTGNVESGGKKNIAMWMLDTDYDNRSLFPSQVFFPMAGEKDGWAKLAKNLKAEIDEEKIEAFRGTISLEFEPGSAIAVKIVDDRGIESLRVINM